MTHKNSHLLSILQAFPETNFPPGKRLNGASRSKLLKLLIGAECVFCAMLMVLLQVS